MGSGRDKRKKLKGAKPGAGADKTARKTEANAEKGARRLERRADGGDDLDALLARFQLADAAETAVRVEPDAPPPTPRVYASFTPVSETEIVLFGGEWYDSAKDRMHVYADLHVLDAPRMAWRRVVSPGGPAPRTSHQAALHRRALYVFGGEFTSLNQAKFRHFGDLWRLSLDDWRWEALPLRGGPSPRSGHRVTVHKNSLYLFGGFYDAGKETRYFNDLWRLDLEALRWEALGPRPGAAAPAPRGGCQLALHAEGGEARLFVFGGYAVRPPPPPAPGAPPAGRKAAARSADADDGGRGITFDDVWCVDLKTFAWEKVKKAGMAPGPRTSFALAPHKGRAVLFGGVFDREGAGDKLFSELYNDAYAFSLAARRWFPLAMRPAARAKAGVAGGGDSGAGADGAAPPPPPGVSPELAATLARLAADKDSAVHRAATRIQAAFRGHVVRAALATYRLGGQVSELLYSPAAYGVDLSAADALRPRARSAPMAAVLKNTLYLAGGIVEVEHTDVVLDDMWALDLNKLDGWRCLRENSARVAGAFAPPSEDEEEEGGELESD
jgi:N-acetylneuraminic acid mutarotase